MKNVAVVDYEMGNIDSVVRSIEECGGTAFMASRKEDFKNVDHIVLPGVGSFSQGMKNLRDRQLDKILYQEVIEKKVPFLGICLGMQFLATLGKEGGETKGLGWIEGEVVKLNPSNCNERIPHMGWNDLNIKNASALFSNIPEKKDFYFVHSYHFDCHNKANILATTPYCSEFVSAIGKNNIFGVQFHPEKSQKAGLKLLSNFLLI